MNQKMASLINFYKRMEAVAADEVRARDEKSGARYRQMIESITSRYSDLLREKLGRGKDFSMMFLLYVRMKDLDRSLLDVWLPDFPPAETLKVFQDYGVKRFTVSCPPGPEYDLKSWLRAGCTIEGMFEINGPSKIPYTTEHEKVPAFLLRVPKK